MQYFLKKILFIGLLVSFSTTGLLYAQGVDSSSDVAEDIKKERQLIKSNEAVDVKVQDTEEKAGQNPFQRYIWIPWIIGIIAIAFMSRAVINLRKIIKSKQELQKILAHEEDFQELLQKSKSVREKGRPLTEDEKKAFYELTQRLLAGKNDGPIEKAAKARFREELDKEMNKRGMSSDKKSKSRFTLIDGGKGGNSTKEGPTL